MQQSREQIVETPVSTQDFLEQDDAIRGQNYVGLSFISPEDVIRSKESYFIKEYMKKYTERNEELINDFQAAVTIEDCQAILAKPDEVP